MPGVVGIRFRDNGKAYRVDPEDFTLMVGDRVIVETAQGREMGIVVQTKRPLLPSEQPDDFPRVIRPADEADLAQYEENCREEQEAFNVCRELIDQRGLEMFLVAAEYTYDERKLLFYFTAEGRIDFRDLVRDLAARFRVRIELRQIGVRDDAKMNGGMGICGRELCCSSWMESFAPVSIRMAKEQNISMNPTKVSGNCGRLLCCLNYENDSYKANRKLLPKQGSLIDLPDGSKAKVLQCDILGLRLTLMPQLADGSWGTSYTINAEEIGWGELRRRKEDEDRGRGREGKGRIGPERERAEKERAEAGSAKASAEAAAESGGRPAETASRGCPKQPLDLQNNTLAASSAAEEAADAAESERSPGQKKSSSRAPQRAKSRRGRTERNRSGGGEGQEGGSGGKPAAKPRAPRQSKLRNSRRSKQGPGAAEGQARKPRYIINPKGKSN